MIASKFLFLDPLSNQIVSPKLPRRGDWDGASLEDYPQNGVENKPAVLVKGLTNETIITLRDKCDRIIVGCAPRGKEGEWVDYVQTLQKYQGYLNTRPHISVKILAKDENDTAASNIVSQFREYGITCQNVHTKWYDHDEAQDVDFSPLGSFIYAFKDSSEA